MEQKIKVAIWGNQSGAIKRFYTLLTNNLHTRCNFVYYDKQNNFLTNEFTRNCMKFDVIVSDISILLNVPKEYLENELFLRKLLILFGSHFDMDTLEHTKILTPNRINLINFASVTQNDILYYNRNLMREINFLPFGIQHDMSSASTREIKTVGILMSDSKNNLFREKKIATLHAVNEVLRKLCIKQKFVYDTELYIDPDILGIDLLLYFPELGGNPFNLLEISVMGIPVLVSTGYDMLECFEKFQSIDNICDLVNRFREHPKELALYIKSVQQEIQTNFDIRNTSQMYWYPFFQKIIKDHAQQTSDDTVDDIFCTVDFESDIDLENFSLLSDVGNPLPPQKYLRGTVHIEKQYGQYSCYGRETCKHCGY